MITLTTDFGLRDGYVAAMKGTMLSIHADARLVDVTHQIDPQDVMEAAFVLNTAVPYTPEGSVHLVVVDPGVGTERRAVAVKSDGHWYVGPDNGVFPLVIGTETPERAVELDNPSAWRTDAPSATFHGRDIFAPAAAHLDRGASLTDLGTPIDSLEPLRWALPMTDEYTVQGWVVHVDRFGNCITNIRRETLARAVDDRPVPAPSPNAQRQEVDVPIDDVPPFKAYAGSSVLNNLHATYGEVAEGEPVMLFGSTGFLEISVNGGDASELLDIRKGDTVKLVFQHPDSPAFLDSA